VLETELLCAALLMGIDDVSGSSSSLKILSYNKNNTRKQYNFWLLKVILLSLDKITIGLVYWRYRG